MSETQRAVLEAWIGMGDRPTDAEMSLVTLERVREAIRAVLEDLRLRDIDCGCNNRVTRLEAERDALRADLSRTLAEVERPFRERIERAEAALREIEQATEGIPEQNCALANHIASVALAGRLKP
jgi:hypothetical protein